jgi:hypothetical protein
MKRPLCFETLTRAYIMGSRPGQQAGETVFVKPSSNLDPRPLASRRQTFSFADREENGIKDARLVSVSVAATRATLPP